MTALMPLVVAVVHFASRIVENAQKKCVTRCIWTLLKFGVPDSRYPPTTYDSGGGTASPDGAGGSSVDARPMPEPVAGADVSVRGEVCAAAGAARTPATSAAPATKTTLRRTRPRVARREWELRVTERPVSYTHLTLPTNREV